jgi:predicted alpha/beta-hydrolase family hydrolase
MKWFDLCARSSSTPIGNQRTQSQQPPGVQSEMLPIPDCGEHSYIGSGKLRGKTAVITGGDSDIGRAVSIAFAREGADVLIAYLNEGEGAGPPRRCRVHKLAKQRHRDVKGGAGLW